MTITRRLALSGAAAAWLGSGAMQAARAAQPLGGAQAPGFHRMKFGDLEVTAVTDGVATPPLDGLVLNQPVSEVQKALAEVFLPTANFTTTYTTLVINTGKTLALIDTANGDMGPPTAGAWMANFRAAGFDPAKVDKVIFSHFHADHINGYRLRDGTSPFPQAEVMVPELEWAFWMDDARASQGDARMRGQFANVRRVFSPLAKNVTLYKWDQDILPGVAALGAPGHTPGHTIYAITSAGARFMLLSDITNNPALFARHPDWVPIFDVDGPVAIASRRRVLDMAASERMQVSFYHAAFPSTGYVERRGSGYDLVPVTWRSPL